MIEPDTYKVMAERERRTHVKPQRDRGRRVETVSETAGRKRRGRGSAASG